MVWDQKGKNKLDRPQKTITFAHANISGHVRNARKSFHLFWGLFFLGLVFIALDNLTTSQHKNTTTGNKEPPPRPQKKTEKNKQQA